MKPIELWEEADIQFLIDSKTPESLTLDYKRSLALSKTSAARNEISKDVAAMANSAGGMLVYGVAELSGGIPSNIDGGIQDGSVTKEWLEQVIASTISPRLAGLKIKEVNLGSGGRAFVLEVQQATNLAPHQSSDQKYYKRQNFHSVPMHDYEIRDALGRGKSPNPLIRFGFTSLTWRESKFEGELIAKITNSTSEPVSYAVISLYFDQRLIGPNGMIESHDKSSFRMVFNEEAYDVSQFRMKHMIPSYIPIFKGQALKQGAILVEAPHPGKYLIGYRIACPGYSRQILGVFRFENHIISSASIDGDFLFEPIEKYLD